ncbi:hypothetical protein ACL02U_07125 [Streptomyces sp. MS06]|uniref:hypothetical protein n=1 Tax=Streptomyces sp. MS06 TaxID=3385974 RepID=UPI0039A2FD9F
MTYGAITAVVPPPTRKSETIMQMRRPPSTAPGSGMLDLEHAESALLEHYVRLVRLVHLTLPVSLGQHRRVLTAHGIVQGALPRRDLRVPWPRHDSGPEDGGAYGVLRLRVLRRAALACGHRSGLPALFPRWRALRRGRLPSVWGLRVFPQVGGADELVLDRELGRSTWPVRAAFALLSLEDLPAVEAGEVLRAIGVRDVAGALTAARALIAGNGRARDAPKAAPARAGSPALGGPDPCLLHARPTDLLRRRHRVRTAAAALVLVLAGLAGAAGAALPHGAGSGTQDARPASRTAGAARQQLLRSPADAWTHTAQLDFAVWPARGRRTGDRALLARAVRAWTDPSWRGHRSVAPGAAHHGTGSASRLLFADDVDGRAVVVLQDGVQTVRYSEPLHGGTPEVAVARTEGADITTAAAVVVSRSAGAERLLLAPWIAEAGIRDLLAPDRLPRRLDRADDGVTAPIAVPPAGGSCRTLPVVQLRSSPRVAENHAFLLADLGELVPAHLTYMPAPRPGVRPRSPREATGQRGLLAWAESACRLNVLRGQGVRSVNHWVFAEQALPEGAGSATWVCARADTWRGTGSVEYLFVPPGRVPARLTGRRRDTAQCSRFGQNVMAHTVWRGPSGDPYLLAAGSRRVARIEVSAPVRATAEGRFLAVRADRPGAVRVTGWLADGERAGSGG